MKYLLIALFISPAALAFNKDFTLVNDRAPLEFRLLFESMKYNLKETNEQIKLLVLAQHINKGLSPLKKDQSFFLLKSEVYKTLLEWPHPPTQFQVGSHTLERLKNNLATNRPVYNMFSQWVMESLIADLENFQQQKLLDLTPAQKGSLTGEKAQQFNKMQRVLKYTRGWLEQADTLSAQDFNALTQSLGWRTLERVKEKAALFRRFSSKAIQDTQENTFNIPEQGMPQANPKAGGVGPMADQPEKGLGDKAADEKADAQASVGTLDVSAADVSTDALSGAIDQIEEETEKPPGGSASAPSKKVTQPGNMSGEKKSPSPTPSDLE